MPAWMLEDDDQQAQHVRKPRARAKTRVFGSSQHSPRKPLKGSRGLAKAHARPPGTDTTDLGGVNVEGTEFLLDAWESDLEDTPGKRKAARCGHA